MIRNKLKLQTGKTYTINDASSTYTIIVGDMREAPSTFADDTASSLSIGAGVPSPESGKIGGIYLDHINKRVHVKDAAGWDSGFDLGGSGGSSEFKVGVGAPSLNLDGGINAYIDMQSMTFHTRSGGSWDEGRLMRGNAGSNGKSVRFGSGPPIASLGDDDEAYIDLNDFKIHTKSAGSWSSGNAFKGSNGQNGKSVKFGNGLPSDAEGADDEIYLDLSNFKIHSKSAGSWGSGHEFKGASGSNGLNGKSVRFGNGTPANDVGDDDEVYFDLSNFKVHAKSSGSWSGGQLFKGDNGSNGQNGINGKSLRFGSGAPSDTDGDDDEVYLDLSSFKVHSKSAGSWGTGLGFKGNDGQNGLNGKSVRFGSGSPSDSLGDDDEVYFDLNDFKVHTKSSGYWDGGSAFKGSDGTPGINGKSIKFGNGAPSNTDGDDDEVYLDLSNFKVHTKATGSWGSGLAFKGNDGSNGKDGTDGAPGKDGVSAQLTNDSDVIPTDSDGTGYDFADTGGEFELRSGGSKITSGVTYYAGAAGTNSSVAVNGLTLTITSGGAYSLSGASWTQPFAKFTMRAIHNGVTYTKVYKVTKARGGAAGINGINGTNGSNGLPGSNGKDGTDGANGKKVVTSSALSLSGSPVGATSYGCEVGDTLIDTVNHKVYTRTNSSTWTLNGSSFKGTAGESSLIGQLTKEVAVIPANSSGAVTAENLTALGGGYFKVYNGKTDVTAACTFSIPGGELSGSDYIAYIDELQLNLNKTTGRFVLSCATWNADSTSFTMQATYSGSTVTKIYNVTKSKTGPGIRVYSVALGSDSSTADVQLTTSYADMYLADVMTNEGNILTASSAKGGSTTFTINQSGRYKIELQAAFRIKNVTKGTTYSATCYAQILKNGVATWSANTTSLSTTLGAYAVASASYESSTVSITKTVFLAAGTVLKMQAKTSSTSGGASYLELATDSETQTAEDTILTITKL